MGPPRLFTCDEERPKADSRPRSHKNPCPKNRGRITDTMRCLRPTRPPLQRLTILNRELDRCCLATTRSHRTSMNTPTTKRELLLNHDTRLRQSKLKIKFFPPTLLRSNPHLHSLRELLDVSTRLRNQSFDISSIDAAHSYRIARASNTIDPWCQIMLPTLHQLESSRTQNYLFRQDFW